MECSVAECQVTLRAYTQFWPAAATQTRSRAQLTKAAERHQQQQIVQLHALFNFSINSQSSNQKKTEKLTGNVEGPISVEKVVTNAVWHISLLFRII